jgi:hypothetical protein
MQSLPRPAGSLTRLTRALRHPRSIRIQARNARPSPPSSARLASSSNIIRSSRHLYRDPISTPARNYSSAAAHQSRTLGETSTASPPVSEPGLEGWETVIGLEIHAQIRTDQKLFSGSRTSFEEEPNTNVVPFDAGFPGTLPVSPYLGTLGDSLLDEW